MDYLCPTINTALLSSVVNAASPMKDSIFEHLRLRHHNNNNASGTPAAPFYGQQYRPLVAGVLGADVFEGRGQEVAPATSGQKGPATLGMSVTEVSAEPVRSKASGRVLCELEALQRKHLQEFSVVAIQVVEALRSVVHQHESIQLQSVEAPMSTDEERFWPFNTATAAPTTAGIFDYVMRLAEFSYVSPASVIMGCMFIDRLLEMYPRLLLTRRNIFKLFGVSVRIANKVLDFKTINNLNFSSVLGIPNEHLNNLEIYLVMNLQFELFVSPVDFFWYARRIAPYHPAVQRLRTLRDVAVENYEVDGGATLDVSGPLEAPTTNWSVFSFAHSPLLREKVIQQARANTAKVSGLKEKVVALISEGGDGEGALSSGHRHLLESYREEKMRNNPPFTYRLLASESKLPTADAAAELAPVQRIIIALQAAGIERNHVQRLEKALVNSPPPRNQSFLKPRTSSISVGSEELSSPLTRKDSGPLHSPSFGSKAGKKVQRARELSRMFAEQLDQSEFLTQNPEEIINLSPSTS